MSDPVNLVYESIDRQHSDKSASTRRQLVGGASALLGSLGLLGLAERAGAMHFRGKYLEEAGFGFGKEGAGPGKFDEFDQVSARTPDPPAVNTRTPA